MRHSSPPSLKVFLFGVFLMVQLSVTAQKIELYQSKKVDLGDIEMQYMDFGGEGPILIWVQDFHNYFEGVYRDTTYFRFFEKLTEGFRVLAPVRRGYGESTYTPWGYDVATQSRDLLRFMDVLGIEKAVFYGRIAASQDMTWIVEHHPERVQGLIYDGNPVLIAGCYDRDVLRFVENFSVLGSDFDKEKQKSILFSRLSWRPRFLHDLDLRFNIPALRFINTYNWPDPALGALESGFLKQWIQEDIPGREEEVLFLRNLLMDSVQVQELHKKLLRCNVSEAIEEGMQRAFGSNLRTVRTTDINFAEEGLAAYLQWKLPYIRAFLRELQGR